MLHRGNWEKLRVGHRYTLSEAAEEIGIDRESLRKNYCGAAAPRAMPAGCRAIYEGTRVAFIVREQTHK